MSSSKANGFEHDENGSSNGQGYALLEKQLAAPHAILTKYQLNGSRHDFSVSILSVITVSGWYDLTSFTAHVEVSVPVVGTIANVDLSLNKPVDLNINLFLVTGKLTLEIKRDGIYFGADLTVLGKTYKFGPSRIIPFPFLVALAPVKSERYLEAHEISATNLKAFSSGPSIANAQVLAAPNAILTHYELLGSKHNFSVTVLGVITISGWIDITAFTAHVEVSLPIVGSIVNVDLGLDKPITLSIDLFLAKGTVTLELKRDGLYFGCQLTVVGKTYSFGPARIIPFPFFVAVENEEAEEDEEEEARVRTSTPTQKKIKNFSRGYTPSSEISVGDGY